MTTPADPLGRAATPPWTRRAVLAALGLGLVGAASSCGVRLESDAPDLPLLPRQKAADEDLLLSLLRSAQEVVDLASLPLASGGAAWVAAWLTQESLAATTHVTELRTALATAHVPSSSYTAPRPQGTAEPSTPGRPGTAYRAATLTDAVAGAQASLVTTHTAAVGSYSAVTASPANRPFVTALLVHHAVSAVHLGGSVSWPAAALPPAAAAVALDQVRALRYGAQVAAAHLTGHARATVVALADEANREEERLGDWAGSAARPAPAGYTLPFAVHSPTTADRLVRTLLGALATDCLRPLAALDDGSGVPAAAETAARWIGLALPWGGSLPPLPGLQR